MELEPEVWKPVVGFEKYYEVSSYGSVKSLERIVKNSRRSYLKTSQILKPGFNTDGYKMVILYHVDYKKTLKVHRLVAESFLDNPLNLEMVNHKDEDKANNYYKNLEWVTRRENGVHRYKSKNTTSNYCGVSWSKANKKWYASIGLNGKQVAIGMYVNEIDAYNARVKFEKDNGIINRYL